MRALERRRRPVEGEGAGASGPGFLALRAARRCPDAQVLAVDRDPVLVELGRRLGHPRVTWRCADLCRRGWTTAGDEGVVDAVVSVMTLHMLDATAVEGLMAGIARTLRPGGLFVDHDEAGLDVSAEAAELAGQGTKSWTGWWAAIAEDPALRTAFALRDASPPGPAAAASRRLQRVAALRRADFAHTSAVRQPGGSHWRITARR